MRRSCWGRKGQLCPCPQAPRLPVGGRSGIARATGGERHGSAVLGLTGRRAAVSPSHRQKRVRARTARGGLALPQGRRWTGQPRCRQTDGQQRPAGATQRGAWAQRGDTAQTPSAVLCRGTLTSTAVSWQQPVCRGTSAART